MQGQARSPHRLRELLGNTGISFPSVCWSICAT